MDQVAAARLRRRRRIDQVLRPRRGDRPVSPASRRRRAGAALLHDEPVAGDPRGAGSARLMAWGSRDAG
ncbi:conserved hypothetical protein [Burkholderiales bacterium 8X]|nr:conserved hypothetical protein [Burkholderiales bacterium 8X]